MPYMSVTPLPDAQTHPRRQWNIRAQNEGPNPLHYIGEFLHPRLNDQIHTQTRVQAENSINTTVISSPIQPREIGDGEVVLWSPSPVPVKPFFRWGNLQHSLAVAVFSPSCGVFIKLSLFNHGWKYMQIIENITRALKAITNQWAKEDSEKPLPLFECHIYAPEFENMPVYRLMIIDELKSEILRLVRPAIKQFFYCRFQVKPFDDSGIVRPEHGPDVEAQWVPEAGRVVIALTRGLALDNAYGRVPDLSWTDKLTVVDVNTVPEPAWVRLVDHDKKKRYLEFYSPLHIH